MTPVIELWLPILLSAVLVFAVSSVLHMFTPWHKSDYATVPNQDRVMDALRPFAIPPGDYMIPRPESMGDMRSAAFKEKMNAGPVIIATVCPNGVMSIGPSLIRWFIYCCVVGLLAGGVAASVFPPGTSYHAVFHVVALVALGGYALALWQASIWLRKSWLTTIKASIDGLVFALLTGGVFGWLWPQ